MGKIKVEIPEEESVVNLFKEEFFTAFKRWPTKKEMNTALKILADDIIDRYFNSEYVRPDLLLEVVKEFRR